MAIRIFNSLGALKSVGAAGATGATGAAGSNGTNGADGASGLGLWTSKVIGAWGNGDPTLMMGMINNHIGSVAAAPTPTNITISIARISYFLPVAAITINKIRFFDIGATSNIYAVALYRFSDLARLTAELDFNTAGGNIWGSAGSALNVTLAANTLYFLAVSARATGTTAGVAAFTPVPASAKPSTSVLPSAYPGNLAAASNYVAGSLGQFAVTTGALPTTAATLAVEAVWTGGMPAFFLDNSNA